MLSNDYFYKKGRMSQRKKVVSPVVLKRMSVTEFADLVGVSRQYVLQNIDRGFTGVKHYERIGRGWVLTVDTKKADKTFVTELQK